MLLHERAIQKQQKEIVSERKSTNYVQNKQVRAKIQKIFPLYFCQGSNVKIGFLILYYDMYNSQIQPLMCLHLGFLTRSSLLL